jgi:hypothetical protein
LSPEETEKIGRLVFLPGSQTPNTKIVGRPATAIAEMAGIHVPSATRVLMARMGAEQVGRDFPLSAEKLSPILAFYSVPNLASGIALCRQLLEFGGLGHTCAIHSQNRSVILEFGEAVPAFRVVVNSSSVHGSIGYSTNLFPAMTLGCGAPGGNITSDNIGPQHLMNVKRVAWESRPIEHRTVHAEERMAGAANPRAPEAVQAKSGVVASADTAAIAAPSSSDAKPQEKKAAESEVTPSSGGVDRTAIARVVEQVMSAQGIARGSGAPRTAVAARELPTPSSIAAEIAGRMFDGGPKTKAKADEGSSVIPASAAHAQEAAVAAVSRRDEVKNSEPPAKAAVEIPGFVSENDVRRAMTRSEKIFVGPKTILTPSARDLGLEHQVFVETEAGALR